MSPDLDVEFLKAQTEANRNTILVLGGLTALGTLAFMRIGPDMVSPLTSTITTITSNTSNIINNSIGSSSSSSSGAKASTPAKAKAKRPVVLTSDNINGKSKDQARLNAIKKGLNAKGWSCSIYGIGPNTHNAVLSSKNTPGNAFVVDIYGGACAGTLAETGLSYHKKIKGTRKEGIIFCCGAKKITGLSWLPRAHDDNFSSITFLGLRNPATYLKNAGVVYTETSDINAMINWIAGQAVV